MTADIHAQAIEAERAVLGAMMLTGDACDRAAELLHARHFYRSAHAKLFLGMLTLRASQTAVDIITLVDHMRRVNELDLVGGPAAICSVMEAATTTANLQHHATIVRRHWQQRETARLAGIIAEHAGDAETVAGAVAELSALEESCSSEDDRWSTESSWANELLAKKIDRPAAIIGDGADGVVLPAGGVGFLVAAGGAGKTFFLLQIARAAITGEPLFGLPTERVRFGLVEGEMTEYACQSRISQLAETNDDLWLRDMRVLSKPRGGMMLKRPEVRARLRRFILSNGLKLCGLDPLNRFHEFTDNSNGGERETLSVLQEIADETGCAFFILHHVRKLPSGVEQSSTSRVSEMHRARGSAVWSDDADCFLTLGEHGRHEGKLHVLKFAKVRHGREPEDIYLTRTDSGFFAQTQSPEELKVTNQVRLETLLAAAGPQGMSTEEGMQASGLGRTTVFKRFKEMGAVSYSPFGSGKSGSRWYLPEFVPKGGLVND